MVDLDTGLGVRAEGFGTRVSAEEFLDAGKATVETFRKSNPGNYHRSMVDYEKAVELAEHQATSKAGETNVEK